MPSDSGREVIITHLSWKITRFLLGCCVVFAPTHLDGASDALRGRSRNATIPVDHFVYIIQENVSFDHYFGTFPGADGIPRDAKFAYRPGEPRTVAPFHLHSTSVPHD